MDKASAVLFFSSQIALPTRTESRVLSGNSLASGLFQKRLSAMLCCASCSLVPSSTYFPFYRSCTILASLCYRPEGLSHTTPRPSYHPIWLYQCVRIHTRSFCKSLLFTVPLKYLPDRYLGKGTAELSQNHVDLLDLFYILVNSSSLCLLLFVGLRRKWGSRFRVSFQ